MGKGNDEMRIVAMICWSLIMFTFIINSNLLTLLEEGNINLNITEQPQFAFFEIYQLRADVVIRKVGHLFMFAMWLLFIYIGVKRLKVAVWITLSLALVTEILQPYFTRDGRLLDVLFNSAGVLLMAFLIHVYLVARGNVKGER
ncbi:VanZ family protein [Virgibacillus halodenitrificans]|uniref:VanZ family protein n=1 Tax=Virgibacillus halodenitrificans TaxID=1482 RepID=UPI001FB2D15D|nr:VanZ family protein [Virgibacillus halodenitrificans]MCJ0929834.1 VanZ family protein [Virgibacillus halodenitrificans]